MHFPRLELLLLVLRMPTLKDVIAQKKAERAALIGGPSDPNTRRPPPTPVKEGPARPGPVKGSRGKEPEQTGFGLPVIPEPEAMPLRPPSSTGGSMSLKDYLNKRRDYQVKRSPSDIGPSASQVTAQSVASLQSAVEAQQASIDALTRQVGALTAQLGRLAQKDDTGRKSKK